MRQPMRADASAASQPVGQKTSKKEEREVLLLLLYYKVCQLLNQHVLPAPEQVRRQVLLMPNCCWISAHSNITWSTPTHKQLVLQANTWSLPTCMPSSHHNHVIAVLWSVLRSTTGHRHCGTSSAAAAAAAVFIAAA